MHGMEMKDPPESADTNADLAHWYHSEKDWRKVPDQCLRAMNAGGVDVRFLNLKIK